MFDLRNKSWSPYISGVLIGSLQLPLYLLLNKTLSGDAGFVVMADYLLELCGKDVYQYDVSFMTWWSAVFLMGTMIGSFVSAKLSKKKKSIVASFWQQPPLNYSRLKRFSFAFIGGYILILGTRFVGDNSSVDGFSGIAKLQINSFLVLICIFITAICMAKLLYKIEGSK